MRADGSVTDIAHLDPAQTGGDLTPCNRVHVELAGRVRDALPDAAATATELTVQSLARAICHYPQADEVIVSGGGVHNSYLMERLRGGGILAGFERLHTVGGEVRAL